MTGKADFTEEEWELVREGPPTAGMVALMAESGGTFRETWALAKAFTEARKEHGESELLDALVAEKPDIKRYKTPRGARRPGPRAADRGGDASWSRRRPPARSRPTGSSRSTWPNAWRKRTRRATSR